MLAVTVPRNRIALWMAHSPNRKTGHRRGRIRENRRRARDKKIFGFLRDRIAEAEHRHRVAGVPVDPLSVFYGSSGIPRGWELTPFPIGIQENGEQMPRWEDLSRWMKVMVSIMLGHQWDLLTFNIHLHPKLEAELVASDQVREKLAERVRKHLGRAVGKGREFFFVLESFSKRTNAPTFLHVHGAALAYNRQEETIIEGAVARAAGHDVRGNLRTARAVHSDWFHTINAGYGDYLFKFSKRFDPRLDDRRLVMSHSMTGAARDLWMDITRPHLRVA